VANGSVSSLPRSGKAGICTDRHLHLQSLCYWTGSIEVHRSLAIEAHLLSAVQAFTPVPIGLIRLRALFRNEFDEASDGMLQGAVTTATALLINATSTCFIAWLTMPDFILTALAVAIPAQVMTGVAVCGLHIRASLKDANRRAELVKRGRKDGLTGLMNKATFTDEVEIALLEKRGGFFLIVDVDHFKRVNDRYWHIVGIASLKPWVPCSPPAQPLPAAFVARSLPFSFPVWKTKVEYGISLLPNQPASVGQHRISTGCSRYRTSPFGGRAACF
jgi:hypothetical protein